MREGKRRPGKPGRWLACSIALCCALHLSGCSAVPREEPVQPPRATVDAEPGERTVVPNPHMKETAAAEAGLREAGVLTEDLDMDGAVSRAMFICLVVGALGAEVPEPETTIPGETWYAPYVKAGYASGLFTNSGEDMSFLPTGGFFMGGRGYDEMEQPILRRDAAAVVAHALPAEEAGAAFTDADRLAELPELLQAEIQTAAKLLPPLEDGSFRGDDYLSCGEAVVCAWKLMEEGRLPSPVERPIPTAEEALRQSGRVIHAGGYIVGPSGKGATYTNSAEALVNAYRAGNRVMEFDFMGTSDGHLAGTHDWLSAVSPAITDGVPLSLEEWMSVDVYGEFTPLCLESLADFMRQHPDLYIVTDVKDSNTEAAAIIAEACPDLVDRFIIQIYKDSEYDEIAALGFQNIIYTLYNLPAADKRDTEHLAEFAAEHPLLGYTYPEALRREWRYTAKMQKIGVLLLTHTINDRDEISACYAEGIDAVYTDNVR